MGLPVENIYAHTKKLRFIKSQISKYIDSHNKMPINLLDFGCGSGSAVSQYLIREEIDYFGVDIHEPSLVYAKENFGANNATFSLEVPTDINFDILVYADILEHLQSPSTILKSHRKLLCDEGLIIGAVPNGYGPFELEKKVDGFLRLTDIIQRISQQKRKYQGRPLYVNNQIPYNEESGHVQFFTKQSLKKTLQNSGFEIESFQNGAFIGAPLSALTILRGQRIAEKNAQIADCLPYWAVSTWYFTAKKCK